MLQVFAIRNMNPLEIVQRTPKTNCGECGYPACLAFAANVAKSGEDPTKCPYINLDGMNLKQEAGTALDKLAKQHDLYLIKHLQEKIQDYDFPAIAPFLGLTVSSENSDILLFSYLGQQVQLGKDHLLLDGKEPEDHRDKILLYNYVYSKGDTPLAGEWIGLESLPNSISKVRTLATYCENRLADLFTGMVKGKILSLCSRLKGTEIVGTSASAAILIPVLPRLPQQLHFWDEEPDDGFDSKAKVLFDQNVLSFLDIESLVFSAERMTDRLISLAQC